MAINIFAGAKNAGKASSSNTAAPSTRAANAASLINGPSGVSETGTTAVKATGIMGKVAGLAKKAIPIAAKYLPGVAGTVAKGLEGLFNDPEWWQQVPGHGISTNQPLNIVKLGKFLDEDRASLIPAQLRPAIASFASFQSNNQSGRVMIPSDQAVTQYLMPQIRKVVNAVPLQTAANYGSVLSVNATVYALWRQLKKCDYLLTHGLTFMPNLNDPAFPVLQVANAAWLQSSIARLEEYLSANVRLPHTLCEYLAWRYGRLYRAHNSAKTAIISYDVVPMTTSISQFNALIYALTSAISLSTELQQANADMYNAYHDHDYYVEIRDDTQYQFDRKEWMLRQNADLGLTTGVEISTNLNPVVIDSDMDNPTTFMSSTVSTYGNDASGVTDILFPIIGCMIYCAIPKVDTNTGYTLQTNAGAPILFYINSSNIWLAWNLIPCLNLQGPDSQVPVDVETLLINMMFAKAIDLYNCQQYTPLYDDSGTYVATVDLTSISYDLGTVSDDILGNEHIFAFANLVNIDRKNSLSYKSAEKSVASEVAKTISTMDIAVAKT